MISLIGGSVLLLLGLGVPVLAFRNYDKAEFIGYEAFQNSKNKAPKLNTSGLNAYVRHPLYLGTFIVVWALVVLIPNSAMFIISVITSLYIFIGAKLEEVKLIEVFEKDYIEYQKKTPMLFPIKF